MRITWKIANLKRDNTTGLVTELSYLILFDSDGETVHHFETLFIEGSENDPNFIPFEDLTEDIVVSWVKDQLGVEKIDEIEKRSKLLLDEKILRTSQSSTTEGIPWQ